MKASIPRPLWSKHLESFSARHRGWLVRLDKLEGGSGELPLQGIELSATTVSVRLGEKGAPTRLRVVRSPVAIEEETRADGAIEALTIRGDTTLTIVFRAVIAADHVDGYVPEAAGIDRPVRIPIDDVTLDGDLCVPAKAIGVVCFAHGSGSGRFSARNRFVAQALNAAGIGTLLLDLLTKEEEAIDAHSAHLRFDIALLADRLIGASDWLGETSDTKRLPVGYFGASTGGGAALVAAAWRTSIRAVVSRGGRPDLAGDKLRRVQCPVQLIVGGRDEVVLDLNEYALTQLRTEKELVVVSNATHLFPEPGALEEVARLATRWFSKHLSRDAKPARAFG